MRRFLIALHAIGVLAFPAFGQSISTPPSGDNQRSSVSQQIGLVKVTIEYSSPDVHAPNGDDRRGKIWGQLVPWGLVDLGFGTCKECPWRAGANENTVFTVSHDVTINGQPLKAGSYGLHVLPMKDEDWTIIFSNNSTSWGSFFYDPKEDALRIKAKPAKSSYHEYLNYEFTTRKPDRATVALQWEDLELPWTVVVDAPADVYMARIREELRNTDGFMWQNWVAAAQYALGVERPADALEFADRAINFRFVGQENFQTLNTLAAAQDAAGKTDEAKATRDKAMNHPTATVMDIHAASRQLMTQGKKEEALKYFELNAKRYPNTWPVHVGLMRGYSAAGRYKDALKHAKLALAQAPDDLNKRNIEAGIKKLEQGQDVN